MTDYVTVKIYKDDLLDMLLERCEFLGNIKRK